MSRPWDGEKTLATDAATGVYHAGSRCDFVTVEFAKRMERRARHAEGLMLDQYVRSGHMAGCSCKLCGAVRAHLAAAKLEDAP